jgi:hypothetical protein
MRCLVKVFSGMFVLGRVAATDIAADKAHAQVDPSIAELNAILTNMLVRFSYFDLIKVSAFLCHRFLRVFSSQWWKCDSYQGIPSGMPKEPQNEFAFRRWAGGIQIHRRLLGVKHNKLFRDQQVLRKRPLLINPLRLAAEAGIARHLEDFFSRVFVAALRPDCLPFQEFDAHIRRRYTHRLPPLGSQMHFDAPGFAVDSGCMDELPQIKIRIEFAIDAGQQVEIKSSGHSQLVVVRLEQLCAGLFEIRSEK